jgi:L-iditol 2-dehydrogenase
MADEKMTAVFLDEAHEMRTDRIPAPSPGPGQALVAIRSVGICGSDVHYYEHGRIGPYVVEEPLILGHECAGEVIALGEGVKTLREGDRVAIEPGVACRRCHYCKEGRYNLCQELTFMATPPDHGALCEYVAWPEDFLYRLPEGVTNEMGAMIEPLSVGMHAVNLVDLSAGEDVCVLGAGPIGQLAMAAARAAGAGTVSIVDLAQDRLEFAVEYGASRTVNAAEQDVEEALGDSADVVLDCVGLPKTIKQSIAIARPGGRIAWVGMAGEEADVPLPAVQSKELLMTGVWRYANVYPTAVDLMAAGRLDPKPLITHRFSFPDEVEQAFQFAAGQHEGALKTVITLE